MTGRRRRTAAAIALTAGITGTTLMLSACGPDDPAGASGTSSTAPSTSPSTNPSTTGPAPSTGNGGPVGGTSNASASRPGTGTGSGSGSGGAKLNGTARGGLTISDGSRWVVMNGTRVDFGTAVRDLTWSRDGSKAAFVDADGDLVTSNPDGSHRVVVVKGGADRVWSHPTWQVLAVDYRSTGLEPKNDLLFAGRIGGVTRLYSAPATAHDATARVLSLNPYSGTNVTPLPQTANAWPDAAGTAGTSVYANSGSGEVYLRDDNLRQQGQALTPGSEPALFSTPQEDEIVFVRSVGGHDHLFLATATPPGHANRDLTPGATTDYTEPAWSPDGWTIAARTPEGIVTLPANGSHAPVKVSDYHGLPAYRG